MNTIYKIITPVIVASSILIGCSNNNQQAKKHADTGLDAKTAQQYKNSIRQLSGTLANVDSMGIYLKKALDASRNANRYMDLFLHFTKEGELDSMRQYDSLNVLEANKLIEYLKRAKSFNNAAIKHVDKVQYTNQKKQ